MISSILRQATGGPGSATSCAHPRRSGLMMFPHLGSRWLYDPTTRRNTRPGVVIAAKGLDRTGPGRWPTNGRPEHLIEACEGSLRRAKLDQIPLRQFHRPTPPCR